MNCPLCYSSNSKKENIISVNNISCLYKQLKIDIERLFKSSDLITFHQCYNCNLLFFEPLCTGDDAFYKALQKFDWYYLDTKEEFHIASEYISEKDKVLDVGCGRGAFSSIIKYKEYIGLDTSTSAKVMAEKKKIKIINDTIENHSLTHKSYYDVVCSFQVLEHVHNPGIFLRSQLDCLKPEGILIISVPSEDSFLKYTVNNSLNLPPHHLTRWTDNALKKIADIFDLELIAIKHEKVQEMHKSWFLNTIIQKIICKEKLIDLSIKRKFLIRVSNIITKLIANKLTQEFLPNGISVVSIYKKRY